MKHVLIINRYDDELSDYNKYIDHDAVHVSYISLTETMRYITSSNCYCIAGLEQLNEEDVLDQAKKIYKKKPIDYVIAISEYDLDAAARIRTELNIVGATVEDNLLCRNKKKMKDALAHSTVRYPKYSEVSSYQDIEKFLLEIGSAIILKPQVGAASEGVIKISELADIPRLSSYAGYEVEEFVEGDIYHVDAIISDNKMPYFKVSKYINT
ncbi:ATP-grasp domain-containing protein, partial [Acinetobacter oleivorans]|uniref:ATP-grasp domain-containing protein n=1 Tax=Acinetobacter oleivorans TaxID=1148157 RepID=UPI001580C160